MQWAPEHPISGKRYTPYLGYWLTLANYNKHLISWAFSGKLLETSPLEYPHFPRKWEHTCTMQPPYAFE